MRSVSVKTLFWLIAASSFIAYTHAEGTLTVKTDPDGIEVWLGDKFIGQSPVIDRKIRAGRYTLKLVDPTQHTSTSEELLIQDGERTVVERAVSSKFGSLKITTSPQGAEVFIATELGRTPLSNDFMNPGRYRIEIRPSNPLFNTEVIEVAVPKGETVFIEKKLRIKPLLSVKNIISLALMAGTAGGFALGVIENGRLEKYLEDGNQPSSAVNGAKTGRALGIIAGSSCLIGLSIIAFF